MKTIKKLSAILLIIAAFVFIQNKVTAQAYAYGTLVIPPINHGELQTANGVMAIMAGNGTAAGTALTGLGVNQPGPAYMLDVYCGSTTNQNINISSATNNVGYMIGGNMVLWHNGNTSCIYVGVGAGTSGAGANNTAMGYNALYSNTYDANTAVGYYALYTNTSGGANTAVGANALYLNTTAQGSTALGYYALYNNNGPNADYNTATGWYSLYHNTTGNNNTANGASALTANTLGSFNVAVGAGALGFNNTGANNTATGSYALYKNTTGINNVAMGYQALNNNVTNSNNTAIGTNTLFFDAADNNIAMGFSALHENTTGTLNVAIGVDAMYFNQGYNGSTAVGDSALYSQSGTPSFYPGNLAIGNSTLYDCQGAQDNTAVGEWAMRHNQGGNDNTALGYTALYANIGGKDNTATGYQALFSNLGSGNSATGLDALYFNTTGNYNTAMGYNAMYGNTVGNNNTAIGQSALLSNNGGSYNTAVGNSALSNSSGSSNTAVGNSALAAFSSGVANTAIGSGAGENNASGENTFLGDNAGLGCNNITMSNDVFVGYNSGPATPGSNIVYLGNTSTGAIMTSSVGSLSTWSDRRIKDSVKANVPGLEFIDKLQPVTFHYSISKENALMGINDTTNWQGKYDVEKITQSGFIAQQVDSAAQACGYNFSGLIRPQGSNDPYKVGYATFVVPLVKAVQELKGKNDTLKATVDSLRSALQNIQTCINQLCGSTGSSFSAHSPESSGSSNSEQNITLSSADAPLLYQNMPNPFSTGTKINYYLPQGTVGAIIVFFDTYGNQIKTVSLSQTGNGTLNITPDNLSNGIYSYSLIVNGNVIDTKRMVLQK